MDSPVDEPRSQIRWVAFDAVGTVMQPCPSAAEMYFRVGQRHGSRLSADEIARRFREMFRRTEQGEPNDLSERRLATSEAVERDRWKTIVTAVIDDVPEPQACFEELFSHFAQPDSWRCFDEVQDTFENLQQAGFRLALASNFDGRLHTVCDGLAPLRSVTCRVVSAEVGFRKPSPRFFEALLAAANCRPEEMLMVGDDRENDWEGARQAGIAAVLVNRRNRPGPGEIANLGELMAKLGIR